MYIDVLPVGEGIAYLPMVAWPFRTLVVLYRMLAIFTEYEILNVWDTVSAHIHLPRMFLYTDYIFEKKKTKWTS